MKHNDTRHDISQSPDQSDAWQHGNQQIKYNPSASDAGIKSRLERRGQACQVTISGRTGARQMQAMPFR